MKKGEIYNNYDLIDDDYFSEKEKEEEIKERRKYILLIIIIILLLLLIFGFGIYFFKTKNKINPSVNNTSSDLFVVHSKPEFGATISSLESYSSKASAFSYTFYIDNSSNKSDVWYSVTLESLTDNSLGTKIDLEKVMYEISNNNNPVFEGKLQNDATVKLVKQKILAGSKDNYELKLWSNSGSGYYKFKVHIKEK